MTRTLGDHWPEYAMEALCLGFFMVSAAGCATLLQHPQSPLAGWTASLVLQRLPMGAAMGATLAAIIYSPLGARSGAHMNPAVTLTFLRLGKIVPADAAGYIAAQFLGGIAGIAGATWLFQGLPAHPAVNYVATLPGPSGPLVAFAAEARPV
jgi:aquaporin Z